MPDTVQSPISDTPVDPIHFGIELQDLATSLYEMPEGDSLSPKQMRTARDIADMFNKSRSGLLSEFTAPPKPGAKEVFGVDPASKPDLTLSTQERIEKEHLKRELRDPIQEMDDSEASRLAIGEFLLTLPNRRNRPVDGGTIVDYLFTRDLKKLAFKDPDYKMAEAIINGGQKEIEKQEKLAEALSSAESTQFSATIILDKLASSTEPLTKVGLRTNNDFRQIFRQEYPGIPEAELDRLFHSGWSYIEAFFKDIDPNYQLFEVAGKEKRGTTYQLNDPELVTTLWADEHIADREPTNTPEMTSKNKVRKSTAARIVDGVIQYSDGSEVIPENKAITVELKNIIDADTTHGKWLSRAELARQLAEKLGLKKDDVEQQLKEIIRLLGPELITSAYSRRGNRVLITRAKGWPS